MVECAAPENTPPPKEDQWKFPWEGGGGEGFGFGPKKPKILYECMKLN